MRIDLFDFDLPEDRIALHPARPRDAARMLVVGPGGRFDDKTVCELPEYVRRGDVLVVNDTKVLPVALRGVRVRGENRSDISWNFTKRLDASTWTAFARPAKRLKTGDRVQFGETIDRACALTALDGTVQAVGEGGEVTVGFDLSGPALEEAIRARGAMPLPPYIAVRRPAEAADDADYQTVYAEREGAVAAPTAGLHFTDELLAKIAEAGTVMVKVTLHVGAGTFLPVKTGDTADHRMHPEWGEVSAAAAKAVNAARAAGGRVIAVGSTSLRLLEAAADESGAVVPFAGETDIFITPGYRFRVVDVLLTNFHLPRSTLFMLVSAFSGLQTMQAAYAHAVAAGYRFYSYGDATLLFRAEASQ
ncbi:MAG TPA: tRNA preQ1(34) S-adenosylmethionine ribosyltransferase-isomerase QueA [Devosiaceae bacterium]|nr:tRNA preQ1(34) S-adenosylmethionine ribosyltransferase-isomerase QueA [Devosiaceae bacterium]